ncbi:hypothetical protein [Frankia sp. AgKG'84/4]
MDLDVRRGQHVGAAVAVSVPIAGTFGGHGLKERGFTDLCTVDYGDVGAWQGADALTTAFDEMHKPFGHTRHSLTTSTSASTVTGPRPAATSMR